MAPHYEFFQRKTGHVNSQVLLPSTHPRAAARRKFGVATLTVREVLKSQLRIRARVRRFTKDAWKKTVSAKANLTRATARTAGATASFAAIARWQAPVPPDANSGIPSGF